MKLEDILNALPTREELAQTLRMQATKSDTGGDMFAAFSIFGAGLLLGAGLALLFAPKPGSELRQDLADKMGEVNERFGLHTNGHDQEASDLT